MTPITPSVGDFKTLEEISNKPPIGKTIIVQIPMEGRMSIEASLIKVMQDNEYQGICVTFEKSYDEITVELSDRNINLDSLRFIDGISNLYGLSEVKNDRILYIHGPMALSELLISIKDLVGTIKSEKKFIIIDSLTSLLLYNPMTQLVDFFHDATKVTTENRALLFVSLFSDHKAKETLESSLEHNTVSLDLRGST